MRKSFIKSTLLSSTILSVAWITMAQFFDTNFVELDTSKMISTSNSNYAICNHNFPSNWRSVSVNGDDLTIATRDKQLLLKKYSQLTLNERSYLENVKTKLNSVIQLGPFNVQSETGFSKLTTFDRNGGTSTMGSGGAGGSSSSSSSSSSGGGMGGGMAVSKTGPNSYIVYKSNFPFNWLRVFINEDVVTIVYRDGKVIMLPQDIMHQDEKASIIALKDEVEKSTQATERLAGSFASSLSNPMDFVSRALGGMFG